MAGLSEAEKLNGIVTGVKDHYNEIVKNESASGGESIKPFCVDGAIMQCTMGSAPGKLTVIDHGVAITGKYAAHDEDRVPGTNIPSFGTCAATGKPCAPSPVPKWLLTDEFSLMTNKRGAAATSAENCALITDSILVCMQGGIIKFVTSGQMMTVGDLLEMLKALFEAMQKGSGGTGNEGKKPAFTGDDGESKRPAGILDGWQLGDWRYFGNTGTFDLKDVNSVTDDDIYKAIDFYDQDNKDVNLPVVAKIMRHLLHEATTPEDMDRLIYLIFNRCLQGGPDFTTGRIPPNLKTIIEAENAFEIYENNSNYDQNNPFNLMTSEEIIRAIENETHQMELNQYVSNPPWACNPKQVIDVCRALKNSHNPYHTEFVDKVISEYMRNYEHAEKDARLLLSIMGNPYLSYEKMYDILEEQIPNPFPAGTNPRYVTDYVSAGQSGTADQRYPILDEADRNNSVSRIQNKYGYYNRYLKEGDDYIPWYIQMESIKE